MLQERGDFAKGWTQKGCDSINKVVEKQPSLESAYMYELNTSTLHYNSFVKRTLDNKDLDSFLSERTLYDLS